MQRKLIIRNSNLFPSSLSFFSLKQTDLWQLWRWVGSKGDLQPYQHLLLPSHSSCAWADTWVLQGWGVKFPAQRVQRGSPHDSHPAKAACGVPACLWAWKDLGKLGTGSSRSTSSCSWERSPVELTLSSSRWKPWWMSLLLCIHLKYYDSLQYMGELCLRQTWHKSTAGWIIPVTFSTQLIKTEIPVWSGPLQRPSPGIPTQQSNPRVEILSSRMQVLEEEQTLYGLTVSFHSGKTRQQFDFSHYRAGMNSSRIPEYQIVITGWKTNTLSSDSD